MDPHDQARPPFEEAILQAGFAARKADAPRLFALLAES
jgi:hypothetical protein